MGVYVCVQVCSGGSGCGGDVCWSVCGQNCKWRRADMLHTLPGTLHTGMGSHDTGLVCMCSLTGVSSNLAAEAVLHCPCVTTCFAMMSSCIDDSATTTTTTTQNNNINNNSQGCNRLMGCAWCPPGAPRHVCALQANGARLHDAPHSQATAKGDHHLEPHPEQPDCAARVFVSCDHPALGVVATQEPKWGALLWRIMCTCLAGTLPVSAPWCCERPHQLGWARYCLQAGEQLVAVCLCVHPQLLLTVVDDDAREVTCGVFSDTANMGCTWDMRRAPQRQASL